MLATKYLSVAVATRDGVVGTLSAMLGTSMRQWTARGSGEESLARKARLEPGATDA